MYDMELFESRRKMLRRGLFTPALDVAVPLLKQAVGQDVWLDAGCGEGWATQYLAEKMPEARAIGLDIASAGVRMAASQWGGKWLWAVGDLACLPLMDGSVKAVVNLLAPAHYGEFARVLGPEGLLIKWMPGDGHLQQLRQASDMPAAQDSRALEFFYKNCDVIGLRRVVATLEIKQDELVDAVAMAPLTMNHRQRALKALAQEDHVLLTSDLYVAWGHIKQTKEIDEP